MLESPSQDLSNRLLLPLVVIHHRLTQLPGLPGGLLLDPRIELPVIIVLENPVPEDAVSLHLGAIRPPDVQIDQLRLVGAEEAMLVPGWFARQEMEACGLEGCDIGHLVGAIGHHEININDVLGGHAGDAGRAAVVDGEEAGALRAEGGDNAVAEDLEDGGPIRVGRDDFDLGFEFTEGHTIEELWLEVVVFGDFFYSGRSHGERPEIEPCFQGVTYCLCQAYTEPVALFILLLGSTLRY